MIEILSQLRIEGSFLKPIKNIHKKSRGSMIFNVSKIIIERQTRIVKMVE